MAYDLSDASFFLYSHKKDSQNLSFKPMVASVFFILRQYPVSTKTDLGYTPTIPERYILNEYDFNVQFKLKRGNATYDNSCPGSLCLNHLGSI